MKHIDHTYYINLDKREDRNIHTLKTVIPFFKLEDHQFTRISAVDTSSAQNLSQRSVGCAQSHINIYKDANKKNYKYILVLEDDLIPVTTQDIFFENLNYLFEKFPDFNLCQLAYNDVTKGQKIGSADSPILFSNNVQTTSAYIIKTSFTNKISPTILNSIEELKKNSNPSLHAIDQCWKRFQSLENKWYLMERVGVQATDYSDIEGRIVSYSC